MVFDARLLRLEDKRKRVPDPVIFDVVTRLGIYHILTEAFQLGVFCGRSSSTAALPRTCGLKRSELKTSVNYSFGYASSRKE